MLSEAEANVIVEQPKFIGEAIAWTREKSKIPRHNFRVTVGIDPPSKPLILIGFVGPVNFSFNLMTLQSQSLRCLTLHVGGHPNPAQGGLDAGPAHKHYWSDDHESRSSYIPDDIDWTSPNTALLSFLEECRITPLGGIDNVYAQKEMA